MHRTESCWCERSRWAVGCLVAIEPDESPQEAAVPQALEEVGVQVELTNLAPYWVGPNFDSDTKWRRSGLRSNTFLTRASLPVSPHPITTK